MTRAELLAALVEFLSAGPVEARVTVLVALPGRNAEPDLVGAFGEIEDGVEVLRQMAQVGGVIHRNGGRMIDSREALRGTLRLRNAEEISDPPLPE